MPSHTAQSFALKGIILLIAVLVLLALVGAVYYYWPVPESEQDLLKRAFVGSGEVACTFTDPHTNESGELYAKDGDLRLEFIAVDEVVELPEEERLLFTTPVSLLMKGETVYLWGGDNGTGTRLSVEEVVLDNFLQFPFTHGPLNDDVFIREYGEWQFSCAQQGVDGGLFDPPDTITFFSIDEMIGESQIGDPSLELEEGTPLQFPIPEGEEVTYEDLQEWFDQQARVIEEMVRQAEEESGEALFDSPVE